MQVYGGERKEQEKGEEPSYNFSPPTLPPLRKKARVWQEGEKRNIQLLFYEKKKVWKEEKQLPPKLSR